jgi:hypothetical protein
MNHPEQPKVLVGSPAGLIAAVPHLLGFTPHDSLVVVGVTPPSGRVQLAMRYDLPGSDEAAAIAEHTVGMLSRRHVPVAAVLGYGPGPLVTPAADAFRQAASRACVKLQDVLRVHDGRYWSYLCHDPSCCPPEGVPFDTAAHPAAKALAAAGLPALPARADLAATIAPLTGSAAAAMARATRRAEQLASRRITSGGQRALDEQGLSAVRDAITAYRDGGSVSLARHAWLALVLTSLPVRDDAWARMDPAHRAAHQRLWTDVTSRAQPGYAAAPASLLAFTAWQCGNGALANVALDRALDDIPGYSMAGLLRGAVDAGLPPSAARLPMTPEEVAASYAGQPGT